MHFLDNLHSRLFREDSVFRKDGYNEKYEPLSFGAAVCHVKESLLTDYEYGTCTLGKGEMIINGNP